MATFAQIKEVRLQIDDPSGFIDILSVDTLPGVGSALAQRCYYLTTDSQYYTAETGAWTVTHLRVGDGRIGEWVDAYGVSKAIRSARLSIIQKLGNEMTLVKNSDGAESSEFVKLLDLYKYHKSLMVDEAEAPPSSSSGRYLKTARPCISGGNL